QARITWRNRNDALKLAGVSETTQWFSAASYLLWGVFGAVSGSFWVMAPSIVSFPLSIATIIIVRRGRRLAPLTKSITIIPMAGSLLDQAADVADVATPDDLPAIPILSTATASITILSTATASIPILSTATASIPILSTGTASIPILSTATASIPILSMSPLPVAPVPVHAATGTIPVLV
ncbi:MAG: hypothetical protein H7146_05530, partial [Burkholderiaceae bacterium]|nr:hypothetical protein [Microbacteriaceae bacterium]